MDAQGAREQRVFIVRVWHEPSAVGPPSWRGSARDLAGGPTAYFASPRDLADFLVLSGAAPPDEAE